MLTGSARIVLLAPAFAFVAIIMAAWAQSDTPKPDAPKPVPAAARTSADPTPISPADQEPISRQMLELTFAESRVNALLAQLHRINSDLKDAQETLRDAREKWTKSLAALRKKHNAEGHNLNPLTKQWEKLPPQPAAPSP